LTNNSLSSLDKKETNNSDMLKILTQIEKDKTKTQELVGKFRQYIPSEYAPNYKEIKILMNIIQTTKNINSVDAN